MAKEDMGLSSGSIGNWPRRTKFCEMSATAKWRVSMREWLLILILVALIFYFLVFPDQSSAILNWLWELFFR